MDARSLEKADEVNRRAKDAALAAFNQASEAARLAYRQALKKAEADYQKALEPLKQKLLAELRKADEELARRLNW